MVTAYWALSCAYWNNFNKIDKIHMCVHIENSDFIRHQYGVHSYLNHRKMLRIREGNMKYHRTIHGKGGD